MGLSSEEAPNACGFDRSFATIRLGIIHHIAAGNTRAAWRFSRSVGWADLSGSGTPKLIKFHLQESRRSSEIRSTHGPVRQGNSPRQHRRRDAPLLSRLRDERDRGPGASGRARRTETGAQARALRDARGEQRLEPPLREVRARRRRGSGQIPPARRQRDLRGAGAHGAGFLDALHADRRAGKFRLDRRGRWPPTGIRSAGSTASPRSCSPTSKKRPSISRRTTTARSRSPRRSRPRCRTS